QVSARTMAGETGNRAPEQTGTEPGGISCGKTKSAERDQIRADVRRRWQPPLCLSRRLRQLSLAAQCAVVFRARQRLRLDRRRRVPRQFWQRAGRLSYAL